MKTETEDERLASNLPVYELRLSLRGTPVAFVRREGKQRIN